jgi:hypothetical protein
MVDIQFILFLLLFQLKLKGEEEVMMVVIIRN